MTNYSALIIYHIQNRKKEKQLTGLCRKLGIRTKALNPADSQKEIGVLAGINRAGAGKHENSLDNGALPELLIFSGLSDELLDIFLAEYRKSGIGPISLKAVVTPHNLNWTVRELTAELIRERAAMLLKGEPS